MICSQTHTPLCSFLLLVNTTPPTTRISDFRAHKFAPLHRPKSRYHLHKPTNDACALPPNSKTGRRTHSEQYSCKWIHGANTRCCSNIRAHDGDCSLYSLDYWGVYFVIAIAIELCSTRGGGRRISWRGRVLAFVAFVCISRIVIECRPLANHVDPIVLNVCTSFPKSMRFLRRKITNLPSFLWSSILPAILVMSFGEISFGDILKIVPESNLIGRFNGYTQIYNRNWYPYGKASQAKIKRRLGI